MIVISRPMMEELQRVLQDFRIQLPTELQEKLLRELQRRAMHVVPRIRVDIVRDPSDNRFLEAAMDGRAAYIITQDKDLLVLGSYKHITMSSPQEVLSYLKSPDSVRSSLPCPGR
jgi:uncharacterized protein